MVLLSNAFDLDLFLMGIEHTFISLLLRYMDILEGGRVHNFYFYFTPDKWVDDGDNGILRGNLDFFEFANINSTVSDEFIK